MENGICSAIKIAHSDSKCSCRGAEQSIRILTRAATARRSHQRRSPCGVYLLAFLDSIFGRA